MGIQRGNAPGQGDELSLDTAVARFKQGQCPCCGKGIGESRGLEYRPKFEDLYCHSCKRSWPDQMDLTYLEEQVSLILSQQESAFPLAGSEEPPTESHDLAETLPARNTAPALARMIRGFSSLLAGVLKRH